MFTVSNKSFQYLYARVFSKIYVLWGLCPDSIFTIFAISNWCFLGAGLRQSLIVGNFHYIKFAPLRENTESRNGKNSKNWVWAQTSEYIYFTKDSRAYNFWKIFFFSNIFSLLIKSSFYMRHPVLHIVTSHLTPRWECEGRTWPQCSSLYYLGTKPSSIILFPRAGSSHDKYTAQVMTSIPH